ncbi:LysR family transcriptional regulator [Vibrio breoganii]|uniref:LysR family transcriptional regulator n=1 Tax=Vibrio breoganii TaxID=553239 RepID=UPI0009F2C055|nr:LysR family transcriptional regulator [Vibrio breoganii]TKF85979.1 LysR family transcriptional regulator [Vibrio breoganii]
MDLNLLTTFLTVYRCRSITQASEQLDLTQPAVSAALKRLEAVVGKALFVREGRGIAPTGAAVALANKIESPLSVLETVEAQDDALKVHCSETVLHLLKDLPGMEFSDASLDENEVFDDLTSQKVDLLIDVLHNKRHSFVVEEVFTDEPVCLTRADHPRIGETMTYEDFYREQHIALKIRRSEMNTIDFLSDKPVAPRSVKVETCSISGMLMLASDSDYIASANRSLAERIAPMLGLKIYTYPIPLNHLHYRMIYHRRYLHDENHKQKREQIKAIFKQHQK